MRQVFVLSSNCLILVGELPLGNPKLSRLDEGKKHAWQLCIPFVRLGQSVHHMSYTVILG